MVAPSNVARIEPSVYDGTISEHTVDDFHLALQDADYGSLEKAADLCDEMLTDDRIRGVLATRIMTLLGHNNEDLLRFEADRATVRKAISVDWWDMLPESELHKLIRWGLLLGVGFAYLHVEQKRDRWLPRIEVWHPRFFSYDYTRRAWKAYDASGNQFYLDSESTQWAIFSPFGATRPWADGLWRSLALYWLVSDRSMRAWGKHNDIHGSAGIVGTLPEGKTTDKASAQRFFSDIKKLQKSARIVLAPGYKVEVLESFGRTWETFRTSIDMCNAAKAIVILGQPLTTEVPHAAKTGAIAAMSVRQDILEYDAESLSTWAHAVPLSRWAEWNFGSAELAPWPIYDVRPGRDMQARASVVNTIADAISKLVASTPDVDVSSIMGEFGIPRTAPEQTKQMKMAEDAPASVALAESPPADQRYADGLAARSRDQGAAALSPDIDAILAILDSLEDSPDWPAILRERLLDRYRDMQAEDFAELVAKSMMIAGLAGRYSELNK